MTTLLILTVVVLIGIAIWQLTKIFDLTQIGSSSTDAESQIANDKDNNINGYLTFAFLGFIYVFTIYCVYHYGSFPLLNNAAAEHGKHVDNLMWISLAIIFFVQTFTQALLHYFGFKYRGRKDRKALFYSDNNKLEAIWTFIPVVVLASLILYGMWAWNEIMDFSDEDDVLYVEVYAKQFGWDIRYAGKDNTLGKANVRFIEGVNVVGVDMSDPNAQDDIMARELRLPLGKKVVLKMRSQDVLHSAYMPHFRAQMNCVPGMITQFAFTPTITTAEMREKKDIVKKINNINKLRMDWSEERIANGEEALDPYEFDYLLLCNKICGASHYNMQAKIVVVEEDEFNQWLEEQTTLGEQVAAAKASDAPEVEEASEAEAATDEEEVVESEAIAQVVK